jgi:hypothetical protein
MKIRGHESNSDESLSTNDGSSTSKDEMDGRSVAQILDQPKINFEEITQT